MSTNRNWYDLRLRDVTPQFVNEAAEHVAGGATVKQTARLMGVPPGTMRAWLRAGAEQVQQAYETGERKHMLEREAALFLAVEKAAGQRAKSLVEEIRDATKDTEWRASAWLLERYEADEFGDTKRVELTGHDGGALAIEDRSASLADVARVLEAVGALAQLGRAADPPEVPDDRPLLPAPIDA